MASIKVKLKNGEIAEYIKPEHCPIPDNVWETPLGYCWAFALRQDEGAEPKCPGKEDACWDGYEW